MRLDLTCKSCRQNHSTETMSSVSADLDEKSWVSFVEKKKILKKSKVFEQVLSLIVPVQIQKIRCLGLGAVTDSSLAMYQLCLLSLLVDHFKEVKEREELEVSLWDPIFTEADKKFISDRLKYVILEDNDDKKAVKNTLFYMPHFPIEVLEKFITETEPEYLLSNDLTVYTNKFTDTKFFQLYPNSARMAKIITEQEEKIKGTGVLSKALDNDEFHIVTKKKQRKRKNAIKYKPAVVDYKFESAFFRKIVMERVTEGNILSNVWDSAFTDLSFLHISP